MPERRDIHLTSDRGHDAEAEQKIIIPAEKVKVQGIETEFFVQPERGFVPQRPTIVRFSNHRNDSDRQSNIDACLDNVACNIVDAPAVQFNDLRHMPDTVFQIIHALEENTGTQVTIVELPFTDNLRLAQFLRQLRLAGSTLEVIRPVFEKSVQTTPTPNDGNSRARTIAHYEFLHQSGVTPDVEEIPLQPGVEIGSESQSVVLRFSNHALDAIADTQLKQQYGASTETVTIPDVRFSPHVQETIKTIRGHITLQEQSGKHVVAIELIAPAQLVARVANDPYLCDKEIVLLRPKFTEPEQDQFNSRTSKRFGGEAAEKLTFDRYVQLQPVLSFIESLKPKKEFIIPQDQPTHTLRPFGADEVENQTRLHDLHDVVIQALILMGAEQWEEALQKLDESTTQDMLRGIGVTLVYVERIIDSELDFETPSQSRYENNTVVIEQYHLSEGFRQYLTQRGHNAAEVEERLRTMCIFARAEELLHVLQTKRTGHHLLSSRGEIVYENPYIHGRGLSRDTTNQMDLSNEQLALEYDVLCVFSDFGIPVPALVWYGYRRFDILRLVLGKDYHHTPVDAPGKDCVIKKVTGGYSVTYPTENQSGWGIFTLSQEGFWDLIPPDEINPIYPAGTKVRFGPAFEITL